MPDSASSFLPRSYDKAPDVIIVGGGVVGLSLGWRLLLAGSKVTLFEKSEVGRGASYAAAGMLGAAAEAHPRHEALFQLAKSSQNSWVSYRNLLEKTTSSFVDYRGDGTFMLAYNDDEERELNRLFDAQISFDATVKLLSREERSELLAFADPTLQMALSCRDDHQVDNRKLVQALKKAYQLSGGKVFSNAFVDEVLDDVVTERPGVVVDGKVHCADFVVVACGHEGGDLLPAPYSDFITRALLPVKGQMLVLQQEEGRIPLFDQVLRSPTTYLVPRLDGKILVGASVEPYQLDLDIHEDTLAELRNHACAMVPALRSLPVCDQWAGIRPGSVDGLPLLGPLGRGRLIFASGLYRNGILLAPIVAQLLSDFILTGNNPEALDPFAPHRLFSLAAE